MITAVLVGILLLTACSSSSKSGSSTTTTTGKNFHVETPDGQVSLSLDGQLPPNWPATFPVPSAATAAGSGSLVNQDKGVMIGVYSTSESPQDVYNFYKTNSSLTVTSSKSAGAGSAYLGTIKLGAQYDGSSVVVASLSGVYIVITLKAGAAAGTTTTT